MEQKLHRGTTTTVSGLNDALSNIVFDPSLFTINPQSEELDTGNVPQLYRATLDHIDSLLDTLTDGVPGTYDELSSDDLKIVETWLDNAAASLISWALDVRLDTGHFQTVSDPEIYQELRTAFSSMVTASDHVFNRLR